MRAGDRGGYGFPEIDPNLRILCEDGQKGSSGEPGRCDAHKPPVWRDLHRRFPETRSHRSVRKKSPRQEDRKNGAKAVFVVPDSSTPQLVARGANPSQARTLSARLISPATSTPCGQARFAGVKSTRDSSRASAGSLEKRSRAFLGSP